MFCFSCPRTEEGTRILTSGASPTWTLSSFRALTSSSSRETPRNSLNTADTRRLKAAKLRCIRDTSVSALHNGFHKLWRPFVPAVCFNDNQPSVLRHIALRVVNAVQRHTHRLPFREHVRDSEYRTQPIGPAYFFAHPGCCYCHFGQLAAFCLTTSVVPARAHQHVGDVALASCKFPRLRHIFTSLAKRSSGFPFRNAIETARLLRSCAWAA